MDRKLVAWARAVKARSGGKALPPLWLFTDCQRLPDPEPVIARLPKGLAGVVLRDGGAGAAARARRIAALCRQRRLLLAIAAAPGEARNPRAGAHLRAGHRTAVRLPEVLTSSAHDARQFRRAFRAGAAPIFLSPVFPTDSHPGARCLGIVRWAALSHRDRGRAGALGGINARTIARLPRWCRFAGAIGALS